MSNSQLLFFFSDISSSLFSLSLGVSSYIYVRPLVLSYRSRIFCPFLKNFSLCFLVCLSLSNFYLSVILFLQVCPSVNNVININCHLWYFSPRISICFSYKVSVFLMKFSKCSCMLSAFFIRSFILLIISIIKLIS